MFPLTATMIVKLQLNKLLNNSLPDFDFILDKLVHTSLMNI